MSLGCSISSEDRATSNDGKVVERMPKAYLMVFHDWPEKTAHLEDASKGRLIDALVRYSRGEADAQNNLQVPEVYLFPVFVAEIKRSEKRYEEISAKRAAAGKAGGEATQAKRREAQANQANASIASKSSNPKECKCDGDSTYCQGRGYTPPLCSEVGLPDDNEALASFLSEMEGKPIVPRQREVTDHDGI